MIYDGVRNVARSHAGRPAIIDAGVTMTYGDLLGRADTLASALAGEAGVGDADLVLALLPNCADFVALFLAASRLGAVLMPIDPALRNREVGAYVDRFSVRAAVTSAAFLNQRPDALAPLPDLRRFAVETLAARAGVTLAERRAPFEGVVAAISTSGSTGAPKIVGRTQRGFLAGFKALSGAIGRSDGDRVLGVTPFHHAHGMASAMLFSLMAAGTLVIMRRFLPRRLVEVVSEHHVSVLVGSPFIFGTVAECVTGASGFATVRTAISSGEAVPAPTSRAFLEKTGVRIRELYGSSETGIVTLDRRPVEGMEIRIVDERGTPVAVGKTGEVQVRSRIMGAGYLGEDGAWRFPLQNGFLPMGDLGHLGADGTLVLQGRRSRRLNIAGVKVDPVEIEHVILALPEIAQVAVSGTIGNRGMSLIKARVVVRPGCDLRRDRLIDHCRKHLAEHKLPRIVERVDSLHVNVMGKRRAGA